MTRQELIDSLIAEVQQHLNFQADTLSDKESYGFKAAKLAVQKLYSVKELYKQEIKDAAKQ